MRLPRPHEFVVALLIAVLVAIGAVLAAWSNYRSMMGYVIRQPQFLVHLVEKHHAEQGKYPATLEAALGKYDRNEDFWGRPFRYRLESDTYRIESYGRDGRPGGEGLDADSTHRTTEQDMQGATLRQFLLERDVLWLDRRNAMLAICVEAAVATFVLCLLIFAQGQPGRARTIKTVGCVGATIVAALATAGLHTAMLTSGH